MDIRSILVAQDFSVYGQTALRTGIWISRLLGAELHQLHVQELHPDLADRPEEAQDTSEDELLRDLERFAQGELPDVPTIDPGEVEITSEILRRISASEGILEYLDTHQLDLVITGTHGRRGLRRLLIGSVAEEMVQRAPVSVLTVGPEAARRRMKRILVPIDFSPHSQQALRYARRFGSALNAEVILLHVVEEALHPAFYTSGVQSIYNAEPLIEDKAEEKLETLWRRTSGPNLPHEVRATGPGQAAPLITEFADEEDCDLIAMSTHGRTALESLFLGSVTRKVVRTAPVPVLTVKSLLLEAHGPA